MSLRDDWIVYCADPQPNETASPRPLPVDQVDALIDQAEMHGVLGALLQKFSAFDADPVFAAAREVARNRNRANAAFSRLLGHEADALMADLHDLPAAVVKGPVFARKLYPAPSLRSFTDIDILASEEALPRIGTVLVDRGFRLAENTPREFKWLHRDNERIMVEVQTDLIHPDSLHGKVSLPYQVIASAPEGAPELLLIALVHGAAHQFERLQHVVDICQAARGLNDEPDQRRFEHLVEAANARFVAVAGLSLAARLFDEPRCLDLVRALGPVNCGGMADALLNRTAIVSTTDQRRAWHNWRRQVFRLLIRWSPT